MTRTEIINTLIKKYGYKKYLEIGVNTPSQPGYNWTGVVCELKHGVDPNVDTTFRMTSDDFFAQNKETYDIIFIDGLHIYKQVVRDIENGLNCLSDNGTIVVHDCNPLEEITQREERASDAWHGSTWRSIVQLRMRDDISIQTIDTDEGCALITKTPSEPFELLDSCRKELLNLISPEQWKQSL